MKDDLIDKLADEIQKNERKLLISSARKIAKTKINKLENRICGKDLISSLSKWTQENYKVSLSPIKLANSIQSNEIPEEIMNVIKTIEDCQLFPSGS